MDDVTNGNLAVPMVEGARPGVKSPQNDDDTYDHLHLSGRDRVVPRCDPKGQRGPREGNYDCFGDVIPGGRCTGCVLGGRCTGCGLGGRCTGCGLCWEVGVLGVGCEVGVLGVGCAGR